jgi:hypothetical protein
LKEATLETYLHSMVPFIVRGKSLQSLYIIIAILPFASLFSYG